MVKLAEKFAGLYKFIPHRRYLPEDLVVNEKLDGEADTDSYEANAEIDALHKNTKEVLENTTNTADVSSIETESEVVGNLKEISPTLTVINVDGVDYKIKEFRDEAKRPWWKFFDEFEYRETPEEAHNYKWYKWFRDDASSAEKKLLCKLDILIAFYSFLGYWVKYIDSSNLNNAYVSGLEQDLGLKGNDLVNIQVLLTVGQAVFEVFWLFALPKFPVTYAMFFSELCWSAFTLASYRVNTVPQMKAMRFMVGAFESVYFPAIHYLFGNWYLPSEANRRGGIFYIGQFLGVLTSGLLQSATFKNLSGTGGLSGWRWMLIVDGCLSFGVALLALLCVPGTPAKCYSLFLTDDEIRLARRRMRKAGYDLGDHNSNLFDWKVWKKVFSTWHIYIFCIVGIFLFNDNNTVAGSFVLWLKSLDKYSIGMVNNLSTIPPALGIIYVILVCGGADITRKRFLSIIVSMILNFIGNVILAVWDVSFGAKWFAFCFAYWSWSQSSVFYALVNDCYRKDSDVKAVAWMIVYTLGLQSSAWMTRLVWPTVDSPRYTVGFATCAGYSIGYILFIGIGYLFYKRDERRDALSNGIYIYNSEDAGSPLPEYLNSSKQE